jgi:transcriptional regulator with XRE-family HTH domain
MEHLPSLKSRQIRAARALLDWSQEDLAGASNLSIATIRKLELGHISPRGKTTGALRHALENAGLEFLEPDGVRHRPGDILIFQGQEGIRSFYDDIYQTMHKKGGEVVVVLASEIPFNKALGEYRFRHYERMIAIKEATFVSCIVTEDRETLPATSYCECRWISKHYVNSVPFYVYDDKYAIIVFDCDPSPKITVIQSRVVAEAFREQFHSMWDKATPLNSTKKTVARK